MTTITITVDETANGQLVYSPDLQKVLQIYILNPSDLQIQAQAAQDKITAAQNDLSVLTPALAASQVVTSPPVVSPPTGQ